MCPVNWVSSLPLQLIDILTKDGLPDLGVVSEKLTTAAKAIEVAFLYDHQANRNLELALARYSWRFEVNRLLGGLQKPKIQQIQQRLKEVATDSGAHSLDKVFELIMEGENFPSYLEKEIKKSLCLQYAAAAQWLIQSSIDILKLDESSFGLIGNPTSPLRALK
ncbi:hypothetical protein ACB094_10G129900 [Castanea mollissima]